MEREYLCLLCKKVILESSIEDHKMDEHLLIKHYGMMWPLFREDSSGRDLAPIPTYDSPIIAKELNVKKVYIRDEGQNTSGSMKDYGVEKAINRGLQYGFKNFSVVSSGNHAVSLALYSKKNNVHAIVFVPASSSKLNALASFDNVLAIGIQDAIFEEVYTIASSINFDNIYSINVNNEEVLGGFHPIASQIDALNPKPSHILSGAGNGTYLAGIISGFYPEINTLPRINPVGMKGAFPIENAFLSKELIFEHKDFLVDEHLIDAAEGSIAIASYSMPQLMYALGLSRGFPLGDLVNDDLNNAYLLLSRDEALVENGVVPEPTGIMGLAAALKHKDKFNPNDILLIAFTGHGIKDIEGIRRIVENKKVADRLIEEAMRRRPDLIFKATPKGKLKNIKIVNKNTPLLELGRIIRRAIEAL